MFGLTLMNEGSVRDWIRHGKFNVTQGKNWEQSGAIGPWIVPLRPGIDLDDLTVITRVNGDERRGVANAYGTRGTYVSCEYQMLSAQQGAGHCLFNNGARYEVHIGS